MLGEKRIFAKIYFLHTHKMSVLQETQKVRLSLEVHIILDSHQCPKAPGHHIELQPLSKTVQ